jgi:hypothetical protein
MATISISEADAWAALQVDLTEADGTEPADKTFIAALIASAEARAAGYVGIALDDLDEVPATVVQAVLLDVQTHYRSRLNPELPAAYWSLIGEYRQWGFG